MSIFPPTCPSSWFPTSECAARASGETTTSGEGFHFVSCCLWTCSMDQTPDNVLGAKI